MVTLTHRRFRSTDEVVNRQLQLSWRVVTRRAGWTGTYIVIYGTACISNWGVALTSVATVLDETDMLQPHFVTSD